MGLTTVILSLFCVLLSARGIAQWIAVRELRARIEEKDRHFDDLSSLVWDYALFVDESGKIGEQASSPEILERWRRYHKVTTDYWRAGKQ